MKIHKTESNLQSHITGFVKFCVKINKRGEENIEATVNCLMRRYGLSVIFACFRKLVILHKNVPFERCFSNDILKES